MSSKHLIQPQGPPLYHNPFRLSWQYCQLQCISGRDPTLGVLKLVIASLCAFKLTFKKTKTTTSWYALTESRRKDSRLVNSGQKMFIHVPGFPTQDSINTESLAMVPHRTDGSVFANSKVVILVNQSDCAFLLPRLVLFPPDRGIPNLSLSYWGLSQIEFALSSC